MNIQNALKGPKYYITGHKVNKKAVKQKFYEINGKQHHLNAFNDKYFNAN